MKAALINFSVDRPRAVFFLTLLATLLAGLLIPRISVDTDPENMLPHDHPARVLHHEVKERFSLSDMMVVGLVNTRHPDGIYNPHTLSNLYALTQAIMELDGVIVDDVMSLPVSDNISQSPEGGISFHWMMEQAPDNAQQSRQIGEWVARLPLLQNTLVSGDNQAAGIYIPIAAKDQSYRIYQEIQAIADGLDLADDEFHLTGLPVAEDTFGVEMFKQMAISAPAAGLLIFVIMLFFFRSAPLVAAPMIVAMSTVIITMGLLIGAGFTVHIMSSMIPIFLMPIAVLDSVHILSEFSDKYQPGVDKKSLARAVINELFRPMLFTSITSMVGFLSLNTASIPPVQVFGSFVALGIGLAFILSITFIPAYMSSLSDKTLNNMAARVHGDGEGKSALARGLRKVPGFTVRASKPLLLLVAGIVLVGAWGVSKIQINDNPMNWFEKSHPIRYADRVLNEHFAGTYEAYLSFSVAAESHKALQEQAQAIVSTAPAAMQQQWQAALERHQDRDQNKGSLNLQALNQDIMEQQFDADAASLPYWDDLALLFEGAAESGKVFLQPDSLAYLDKLQAALNHSAWVDKTSGLTDLLKTVNRELHDGSEAHYQLPTSAAAAAQAVMTYQSSHRPQHVWHMVTPDYQSSIIWLQLKSGDNQDMSQVVNFVEQWLQDNPLPQGWEMHWSGLSYINVAWQDAMVTGMLESLAASFVIVAVMMAFLLRSFIWGLVAMLPLSVTIIFTYGLIGHAGKNYDMPVAVLSALTLGMSVDFAIHFIERARALVARHGSWKQGLLDLFEEPGRAISRNAIVIALGFTPLFFAPLVPYQTVGFFMAAIMSISGLTTLLVLPAVMQLFSQRLFKRELGKVQ